MRSLKSKILLSITALGIALGPGIFLWNPSANGNSDPISQETKVVKESTGKYNRLIHEKSPYLLQHADNPIYWYPWGEEAFKAAVAENKQIGRAHV